MQSSNFKKIKTYGVNPYETNGITKRVCTEKSVEKKPEIPRKEVEKNPDPPKVEKKDPPPPVSRKIEEKKEQRDVPSIPQRRDVPSIPQRRDKKPENGSDPVKEDNLKRPSVPHVKRDTHSPEKKPDPHAIINEIESDEMAQEGRFKFSTKIPLCPTYKNVTRTYRGGIEALILPK